MKLSNLSLRTKILICVSSAVFIMSLSLFLIMRVDSYALRIMGDSYKSNEELNSFLTDLSATENSMEQYINYHTFESIDSYYTYNVKVDDFCKKLQSNPSTNHLLQKEYIVKQIGSSFLYYSRKTIASRRANNEKDTQFYYKKTTSCYKILLSEISELNNLLLKKNGDVYHKDKSNIEAITRNSIIFYVIFLVLIIALVYLLIDNITHPLTDISKVALRIADQDFDVPLFNTTSTDEVGTIMRAFDRMIISIREYIDKIWEKARAENELKEKEVEMQALYADAQLRAFQNQINPHFLFNTLNTGAQLAMMEDADKTCYFLEQVSNFFRYNIQQQDRNSTVSEELGLVDNFVYIMKVRFGQRLDFQKDIPEEPLNQLLPSMTLQPLVENCIKHGLKNTRGCVKLQVKNLSEYVEIYVSDNGNGFDPSVKKQIFDIVQSDKIGEINHVLSPETNKNNTEEHTGIGLINVYYRLKLFYHRDDVFDIQSGDNNSGTKFVIRIPKNV